MSQSIESRSATSCAGRVRDRTRWCLGGAYSLFQAQHTNYFVFLWASKSRLCNATPTGWQYHAIPTPLLQHWEDCITKWKFPTWTDSDSDPDSFRGVGGPGPLRTPSSCSPWRPSRAGSRPPSWTSGTTTRTWAAGHGERDSAHNQLFMSF